MKILPANRFAGAPETGVEFGPYYFVKEWIERGI